MRQIIYASFQYKAWRRKIFARDSKTCQECGATDKQLHVHHTPYEFAAILRDFNIKCFTDALFVPILWDTNNGQVLCVDCHRHTFGYKGAKRDGTEKESDYAVVLV